MSMTQVQVGDTLKFRWVNSSVIVASVGAIWHAIYDSAETLVNSVTMTSSGNGLYYALARVNTPGNYVSHWEATIGGLPYVRREKFRAVRTEVG